MLLLQLDCMRSAQNDITSALYDLFQNTIHAMPRHPIEIGYPGYRSYIQELSDINEAIRLITREVSNAGLSFSRRLAINPSRYQPSEYNCFPAHLPMPPTIDAFLNSICNTHVCANQWETHFREHSAQEISAYLYSMVDMIQYHPKREDMARYFGWKVGKFIEFLAQRTSLFGVKIMMDLLPLNQNNVVSSVGTDMTSIDLTLSLYTNEIKTRLDTCLSVNTLTFNQEFSQFRQSLSEGLQKHSPFKEMILNELNDKLKSKLPSSSAHLDILRTYIQQSFTRLSEPLPSYVRPMLDQLQANYNSAPLLTKQYNKKYFLGALKEKITQFPEKPYAECYRLTKADMTPAIQQMLNSGYGVRLFSHPKHRFKDFITTLSNSDIDYESVYPLT